MNKMRKIAVFMVLLGVFSPVSASTCRNPAVKHKFDVQNGYPNGRKGYVVDHICALAQGGLDTTTNMQYQTIEEGKKKDLIENTAYGKAMFCTKSNSLPYRTVYNCN